MGFGRAGALAILCGCTYAQPVLTWTLTRSDHFEVFSQGNDAAARSTLIWFEQLRAFYLQKTGLSQDALPPVRVIRFHSSSDYEPYRLRAASDAQYIGTGSRDYIVMSTTDDGQFGIAAHEYAHSFLHAAGLHFPPWFSEGLAEFFSTVRIGQPDCSLGGDLPARTQILERRRWMPLEELIALPANSSVRDNRDTAAVFYSESWALSSMLVLSPEYGPRFAAFIAALASGTPGSDALQSVYGKSLDAITRDLHAWVAIKHQPVPLSGIQVRPFALQPSVPVSPYRARTLVAEMLLAAGELDRAATLYRDLEQEAPQDAEVSAALGAIVLRKGDRDGARREWKRAIDQGIDDATLCYQYASLAEMAGVPEAEIRPVLERAVTLKPDFDDARYHLALLEKNAGHYEAAVKQLRAMRSIAPRRAYNYWIAMADALVELNRRDEARNAAKSALQHATTAAERAHADQLEYFADTDLAVQFTSGADGRVEMTTTRVEHNTTDWNPFIEPGDKIRHVEGVLREIDCSGSATQFVVEGAAGRVTIAIADPGRVQMRNAPAEFTCGAQKPARVVVDYAAAGPGARVDGLARGIKFQ